MSRSVQKRMEKTKAFQFTLIEVIIIIVIVALLSALILPFIAKKRQESIKLKCKNNLTQIGLSMCAYYGVYSNRPNISGRKGLQLLASEGFLENTQCYVCPNTNDIVKTKNDIATNSSYAYVGGKDEDHKLGTALASDRAYNHNKFGNILFIDAHVKGFSGANWSSNRGKSILGDFK